MRSLVLPTVVLCLTAGCSLVRGTKAAPDAPAPVEVKALTPDFGAEGGEFLLDLEVQNPVQRVAEVTELEWEIWLDGRLFAAGTQALEEELQAAERRPLRVSLPVALRRPVFSLPRTVHAAVRGVLSIQRTGFDRALRFEQKLVLEKARVPVQSFDD